MSGFTDDRGVVAGMQFADNWDLSARRALNVTRALLADGLPPRCGVFRRVRFAAAGGLQRHSGGARAQSPRGDRAHAPAPASGGGFGPISGIEDPVAWAAAHPADPVRRRMLQALALRAQAQPPGALRAKLVAALQRRASRAPVAHARRERPALAHPLAGLLALLPADAGQDLRQVRLHQGTWRQLRVARSLADLNAPAAGHFGPLNGQALAARALQQIQALSPDYLHRLITQMDAISALDLLPVPGDAEKPARAARKKAARR